MQAKLLKLTDAYEVYHRASTGRKKSDYIGKIGTLSHPVRRPETRHIYLWDLAFPDGARFCVEPEQIQMLGE